MMRQLDFAGIAPADYRRSLPRVTEGIDDALAAVTGVFEDVAAHGQQALLDLSERFDRVRPPHLRVPAEALTKALDGLDPALRESFQIAIDRRRQVCEQVETEIEWKQTELAPGAIVGRRLVPVGRVGLYVPGGLAPLASSVIHNAVPAQVAGVGSIALASPPQAEFDGLPHPAILALCAMLGIDEVYAVGGAQAIAMFSLGVEGLCAPVDMITGPGNKYVVAAKRLARSRTGIDAEAGPTEVAIIADPDADPTLVAADLLSQAEHDPLAAAVLITWSESLADQVAGALDQQLAALPTVDRARTALAGEQSAVVLVRDLDQAIEVANAYGAEHLEIHTRDAEQVAGRITSAGAIFVGAHSPVSVGDYSAGSTHVLPTNGAAAHSSGLGVRTFMKSIHVINYSEQGLDQIADQVARFAEAEQLPGHAAAITIRSGRASVGREDRP